MHTDSEVSARYSSGELLARLNAASSDDGVEPAHLSLQALAPYDQFRGRGLEATIEMAGIMPVHSSDHVLDVGSGIGGHARYVATHFRRRVTGIDLTPEFCEVARHLTRLLGLQNQVKFEVGDARRCPLRKPASTAGTR